MSFPILLVLFLSAPAQKPAPAAEPKPPVPGKFTVKGSLYPDDIKKTIRERGHEVRACYEKALSAEPGLGGTLHAEWTIEKDGKTSHVQVTEGTLTSEMKKKPSRAPLLECVTKALGAWVFALPRDGGTVVVTYPFAFGTRTETIEIKK